ncbi:MAG TPA: putative metal-dependent hydrolase [Terriglobales bacterium]|nr:putative metal-dependent hydrolase [Terriglobales bacterium]
MPDLSYPIGKFIPESNVPAQGRARLIAQIAEAPVRLRAAVEGLSPQQLDTPYRPQGWTVRQVVHHVPDSHMNAYIRFKLALTETEPTIKPYEQQLWAELADTRQTPIETSLTLLECLHRRWVLLLQSIPEDDWKRTFRHPELGILHLDTNLALYAWHGRHHVAHITGLRQRMGWTAIRAAHP